MHNLEGKVAVVTGAASGIGLALCEHFFAAGMRVVMADVERAALEEAAGKLAAQGGEVLSQVVDVADAEQMQALHDVTLARFGGVHVVCNNAGVSGRGAPIAEQTALDWQWVLGVNLWGVIHGMRLFLPHLIDQDEGHIVNTASIAGLTSMPGLGPYNVSKHGVVTLSETLYHELTGKGSAVGVSVLCPGAVATRIHEAGRNRPDALKNPPRQLSEEQRARAEQTREMMGAILAAGLRPAAVAEEVLAAIESGRFYVLTHPEVKPLVEQRAKEIVRQDNPGSLG